LIIRAREVKNAYFRALMSASISIFSVGIVWGLLSNFGFIPMPLTGVNFPLVSYGGSMTVAHLALIGLMFGIIRRKSVQVFE